MLRPRGGRGARTEHHHYPLFTLSPAAAAGVNGGFFCSLLGAAGTIPMDADGCRASGVRNIHRRVMRRPGV